MGENGADEIRSECYGACITEGNDVMLRYAEPDNDGTAHLLITDGLADLKGQHACPLHLCRGQIATVFLCHFRRYAGPQHLYPFPQLSVHAARRHV